MSGDKGLGLKGWLSGAKQKEARVELTEKSLSLDKHRVAVLPFANMSPDPQDEYFADGMTEEVISTLSKLPEVEVISRTSVMQYKKNPKSIKEVSKELDVGAVLEGSVRKAGNKLRIAIQMIDPERDRHLWAMSYDRELQDIFAIQSEVAAKVAGTLEVKLASNNLVATQLVPNVDAYSMCMRARSLNDRRNREANEQAITIYNEVLKLNPSNSKAVAGLADCYRVAWDWRFMDTTFAKAKTRELATEAMSLDDTLAEPHATLGTILDDEHHWDEAEAEYRKAISLNPNYVWAHQWYSIHLAIVGRPHDGLRESLRAKQLDPLSPAMMWNLAGSYFCAGKIDEAISEYTKLLKLEPGFARAYDFRGGLYSLKGLKKETLADWETYHNLTKDEYGATLNMAASETLWGSKERALELAEDAVSLLEKAPTEFSLSGGLVWIYALIGDREKFFEWLDRAIERDEVFIGALRYDPNFKVMREDPRYCEALKKLNLGESREIIGPSPQR